MSETPGEAAAVTYCGVTFAANAVGGSTATGQPVAVERSVITGLAVHAVVSRHRAIAQMIASVVLIAIAGVLALSAIGAIKLFGGSVLGTRGINVGIIIALLALAAKLFSTAWDPRHELRVITMDGTTTLTLRPTPEPFELIKVLEGVQQGLGYTVALYPEPGVGTGGAAL